MKNKKISNLKKDVAFAKKNNPSNLEATQRELDKASTEEKDLKNIRETKAYKNLTSYMAVAIAEGFCEGEGASEEEKHAAWQYIIDKGLCSGLQGWFGRTAESLIEQGLCVPAKA